MRNSISKIMALSLLLLMLSLPAFAETSTVTVYGLGSYGRINLYEDNVFIDNFYAAEFRMGIDGKYTTGYCAELGIPIEANVDYTAEKNAALPESPWCEIAYILSNYETTDDFSGSVLQLAVWKLVHPDRNITTDNLEVEEETNAILDEATGMCPLMCEQEGDMAAEFELGEISEDEGALSTVVTLTQNGSPVANQEIAISLENAELVEPVDGLATTDALGQVSLLAQIQDAEASVFVEVSAEGKELLYMDLGGEIQNLTSYMAGDTCNHQQAFEIEAAVEECGACEGKLTEMEMQYLGEEALVQVYEKKKNKPESLVFEGVLQTDEIFSFNGTGIGKDDTLGKKISIYVSSVEQCCGHGHHCNNHCGHHGHNCHNNKAIKIETDCKKKHTAEVGSVYGDFVVISAVSSIGGPLCEEAALAQGELCSDQNKPSRLEMLFTGDTCDASSNEQGDKFACDDLGALSDSVYVIAGNNRGTYFEGPVELNATFDINAANAGENMLKANTYVEIYDADGDVLLQDLVFHTSCSVPLVVGDQYGSLVIVGYNVQ